MNGFEFFASFLTALIILLGLIYLAYGDDLNNLNF